MAIIWNVAALISLSWILPNDELALKNELSRLESSWSSLDGWLNFWTLAVVIGVAVELVVIIVEHRHAMHDFNRGIIRPPDRPSGWLLGLGLLGAGVVAIGVAGEFSVHIRASRIESDMRNATGRLAGIANGKSADANERASANEKEAAGLRKAAEDERQARVKIEDAVTWRALTDAQQKELGSKLNSFSGQFAGCGFFANDMEAFGFSSDIAAALRLAKWQVIPPSPWPSGMTFSSPPTTTSPVVSVPTGVEIYASDMNRSSAATALVRELNKLGFDAVMKVTPRNGVAIGVFILPRPQGAQGAAKLRQEAAATIRSTTEHRR